MNGRRTFSRHASLALASLGCLLATACGGGGGGGGTIPPGVVATFTGNAPGDVSMAAGASSNDDFDVKVMVDSIDDLFGAAFHITFNSASATFVGHSSAGSILLGAGISTDFQSSTVGPGEIAVSATRVGQVAGVNNATGLLVTLHFQATAATAGNSFVFTPNGSLEVTICPTAGGACSQIQGQGVLTWTGGTLTAS